MPPIRTISNLPFSNVRTSSGCSNRFSTTSRFTCPRLRVARIISSTSRSRSRSEQFRIYPSRTSELRRAARTASALHPGLRVRGYASPGSSPRRRAAGLDRNNFEFTLLERPNFVGLLEPLQHYIQVYVSAATRRQDHLLDVAQPVLAEKNLVVDKEGGRAESAPRDRALRIFEQPRLDVGVLDQLAKALRIEIRLEQGGPQYRWIVELFGLRAHMPVDLVDIALEHAEPLGRDGAAHDGQSIDRKERVVPRAGDAMALQETRCLQAL